MARRAVNLSLNADLVREARALSGNLSQRVEILLAEYVDAERTRRNEGQAALDRALDDWNRIAEEYGSFVDEYSTL